MEIQELWKIENDSDAEFIIEKCNEDLTEINRFRLSLEEKLEEIRDKLNKLKDEEDYVINRRNSFLAEYFETIDNKFKKKTKTQEKYRLPSGEIIKKYPSPEFKRDESRLLKWLDDNDLREYSEIKITPKWGELKKVTQVVNGQVIYTETGEIVEGVELIERPPAIEFKEA